MLLLLGSVLTRVVLNSMTVAENKTSGLKAFYLAEAGIEKIKYELKKNPNWYTDLPHYPSVDTEWIINKAKVNTFIVVREKDKLRAFAVGKSKKSIRMIRIEFELNPFKQESWAIL